MTGSAPTFFFSMISIASNTVASGQIEKISPPFLARIASMFPLTSIRSTITCRGGRIEADENKTPPKGVAMEFLARETDRFSGLRISAQLSRANARQWPVDRGVELLR